jgi:hypothetical protein
MNALRELYARYLTTIRREAGKLFVVVVDDRLAESKGNLELRLYDMNQSAPVWTFDKNIQLPADSGKIRVYIPCPAELADEKNAGAYVLESRFRNAEGKVFRRLHLLCSPKDLKLSFNPFIVSYSTGQLYLEAKSVAFQIHLPDDCDASANDFDMLPGEKKIIKTNRNLNINEIQHLGKVLAMCK